MRTASHKAAQPTSVASPNERCSNPGGILLVLLLVSNTYLTVRGVNSLPSTFAHRINISLAPSFRQVQINQRRRKWKHRNNGSFHNRYQLSWRGGSTNATLGNDDETQTNSNNLPAQHRNYPDPTSESRARCKAVGCRGASSKSHTAILLEHERNAPSTQ